MTGAGFTVTWTSPAQRALRNLPEKAATAAVEFSYGSLTDNPHRVGKPLRNELAGLHSARRGGYRVIYRINTDQQAIEILAIERCHPGRFQPYGKQNRPAPERSPGPGGWVD